MKKIISFLIVYMLLCVNVFAGSNYTIIDMSEFASVGDFSEGLCAVQDKNTNRWGFVDVNKNWVISPQFQNASYFKNGFCAVNTADSETVMINRKGNVVFRASDYYGVIGSGTNFFVDKHGKYFILWDGEGEWSTYKIKLLDENYNALLTDDVQLSTFKVSTVKSPYVSHTFFWEINQGKIYNYKGVDISEKLKKENLNLSNDMVANNKYIIGHADGKIKCFDVDGNKIAEFVDSNEIILRDDIIICNNKVYNILENKVAFDGQDINVQEIVPYYNKYFTVKKRKGTTALYTKSGNLLLDFGKWDSIIPLSTSKHIIVSANNKYGLSDYEGNLTFPIEYINGYTSEGGKFAILRTSKDGDITIDPSTLKYLNNSFRAGNKYHMLGNQQIIDNNFNVVYTSDRKTNYFRGYLNSIGDGVIKRIHSGSPATYSFLIFDDSGVKVKIDGSKLEFDVLPIVQNGRTLVPMRAIFEALGADIEWNGETQTITAKNKDVAVQMQIGSNTLTKNGQSIQMDVCPQLVDGRTMVPVRAVSDSFNVTVDWDGYTQTVSLFTN